MANSKSLPKDFKGYKLKSLDELIESLDFGMEVNFFLNGKWYLIESAGERKLIALCPDGDPEYFDSWDDLFAGYKVDGMPLRELWKDFEVESL